MKNATVFLDVAHAFTRRGNECHFILPLGGMWRGATTGKEENAGREYECDGFFHGLIV